MGVQSSSHIIVSRRIGLEQGHLRQLQAEHSNGKQAVQGSIAPSPTSVADSPATASLSVSKTHKSHSSTRLTGRQERRALATLTESQINARS